jgi:C-terminal processing protease CtpA/Prc
VEKIDENPSVDPRLVLSQAMMREDLNQYHDAVLDAWAYSASKASNQGVNVSRSRDNLLTQITEETTPAQFAMILRKFAASLKDGHSEVYTGTLDEPLPYSWPIGFTLVRDGIIVANLNWLKDNPGIRLGDRLTKVNGVPINEFLDMRLEMTSASTDDARKVIAVDQLHWFDSPRVQLTFTRQDNSEVEETFQCFKERIDYRPTQPPRFCTWKALPNQSVCIRIPSFAWNHEGFAAARTGNERDAAIAVAKNEIDTAFSAAEDSTGIILDLRDNGGGFELLSSYVAEHLVPGNFTYFELERQDSILLRLQAGYRDMGSDAFNVRRPEQPRCYNDIRHFHGEPFKGRLVVLINERCFSTTDNLCAFLQDVRPQTKFVGRSTNGGTGEPAIVATLANSGARIQLCVSRIYSPKGRMIEGTGTKPDLEVEPDRESKLLGRDTAIEAAISLLSNW